MHWNNKVSVMTEVQYFVAWVNRFKNAVKWREASPMGLPYKGIQFCCQNMHKLYSSDRSSTPNPRMDVQDFNILLPSRSMFPIFTTTHGISFLLIEKFLFMEMPKLWSYQPVLKTLIREKLRNFTFTWADLLHFGQIRETIPLHLSLCIHSFCVQMNEHWFFQVETLLQYSKIPV